MATTWLEYPHPLAEAKWMTTSGRIINAPRLETTSAARKVRLMGSEDSLPAKERDDLIQREVTRRANTVAGDRLWFRLPPGEDMAAWRTSQRLSRLISADVALDAERNPRALKLHLTEPMPKGGDARTTVAFWRYEHPTLPISALVSATMEASYSYNTHKNTATKVTSRLSTSLLSKQRWFTEQTVRMDHGDRASYYFGTSADDLVEAEPAKASWTTLTEREADYEDQRAAVVDMLKRVRHIGGFEEVYLPDTRDNDPANHTWLTLHLVETNVTPEFTSQLNAFLNDESIVAEVHATYEEMRTKLRKLGIHMPDKRKDEFYRALMGEMVQGVDIHLWQDPTSETRQGRRSADPGHRVHFDITTGAMAIECVTPHLPDLENVSLEWERSLAIAQVTGQEDELLAYARRYVKEQEAKKARAHMRGRHAAVTDPATQDATDGTATTTEENTP